MRVSLIGTVHVDSGLANTDALIALIERLRPDVIFAEVPSTSVEQYIDGSRGTLESVAVARYRANGQISVVPVDLPEPDAEFFRSARELFGRVERTSADYRRLVDRHSSVTRFEGFPYLNSERCIRAWSDIHVEVQATLDWMGQPSSHEIYARWRNQNELRDAAMVKGIEEYAVRHGLDHGLLLIGAAHRKSVADKGHSRSATACCRIGWELDIPF